MISIKFLLYIILFQFFKLSVILHVFLLPSQGAKSKTEDVDPKKLKKQEKEEKDFRKKFKVCCIKISCEVQSANEKTL